MRRSVISMNNFQSQNLGFSRGIIWLFFFFFGGAAEFRPANSSTNKEPVVPPSTPL